MKLRAIMSQPVITVKQDTTLDIVASLMLENGYGCVPVIEDDGAIVGIITLGEFVSKEKTLPFSRFSFQTLFGHSLKEGMETIYEVARKMTARDIMKECRVVLTEEDTVKTFLEQIAEHGITHVPIVRNGLLVGIVARQDLLKMVAKRIPH